MTKTVLECHNCNRRIPNNVKHYCKQMWNKGLNPVIADPNDPMILMYFNLVEMTDDEMLELEIDEGQTDDDTSSDDEYYGEQLVPESEDDMFL